MGVQRQWGLTLLKEKRVWRPQALQALVEFQLKAVNRQQTITMIGIGVIRLLGVLHAISSKTTRIVRVGKRTRNQSMLPKARANKAALLALLQAKVHS